MISCWKAEPEAELAGNQLYVVGRAAAFQLSGCGSGARPGDMRSIC